MYGPGGFGKTKDKERIMSTSDREYNNDEAKRAFNRSLDYYCSAAHTPEVVMIKRPGWIKRTKLWINGLTTVQSVVLAVGVGSISYIILMGALVWGLYGKGV
jgi:hypothetical protein